MMRLWLALLFFQIVAPENATNYASDTLKFVDETQAKLNLKNNSNIILVIGNTSSGKTTLVHYVAGDSSKMISKEPDNPNFSDFEIQDGLDLMRDSIISSTGSRTFIPEMIVDEEQNVWYDCPGFHDTHNETVEIVTAFLIRSIINSASSMKIVLVVDYESVTKGHGRSDFNELLSQTTQLLKNTKQFENSVSLVVTKVPSFKIRGRRYAEIFENNVKNTSAQFLNEYRSVLLEKGRNEKKIVLIDALLRKSDDDYPKISIFWRPNSVGPLNKIPKLTSARHLIRESIHKGTNYTQFQSKDIGFPLSPHVQLYIKTMIEQLIDNIPTKLKNLINQLQGKLRERISLEIDFKKMFERIATEWQRLHDSTKGADMMEKISEQIQVIIEGFSLNTDDFEEFTQIERDERNLNILESLLQETNLNYLKSAPRIDYKPYVNEFYAFFKKCEDDVQSDLVSEVKQTMQNVSIVIEDIDTRLMAEMRDKLVQTPFHGRLKVLQNGKKSVKYNVEQSNLTIEHRMEQFWTLIREFNITSIDTVELTHTERLNSHLNNLISMSKTEISVPIAAIIGGSSKVIHFLSSEYDWYSVLDQVYEFLASYEVQNSIEAYNVAQLSDWGQPNKPQGLFITTENFNEFVRRFTSMLEFESTSSRLDELNNIISTTIKSPPKFHCTDEVMTIEGNFIKSSDIQLSKCPSIRALKRLNVFVVDKFYVDSDLNLNGFESAALHILANTWTILQPVTFQLNGFNGASAPHTAPTTNGTAGKPGNPGMKSGNFFGMANGVVNGSLLMVELIGGNGGDGQDGTGNEDVEVVEKLEPSNDDRYSGTYNIYPRDYWTKSAKFQNGAFVKEFDGWNATYMNSTLSHLLEKEIKYSRTIFSGHCCGVTGTGGTGGIGGESGYYEFIQTMNNTRSLPKKIQRNGTNGKKGQNGRLCKTTGLIHQRTCIYRGFDEKETIAFRNKKVSYETIEDTHCPDKYVSHPEIITQPPRDLYIARTIIEFKTFLRENMRNPLLLPIAQKTYDAI